MPFFSFREGIFGRLEKILKVFGLGADIQKRTIRWWLLTKRPLGASRLSQASNSSLAGEVRNAGDFQAAVTVAGHFAPRCEAPPPPEVQKSKIGFRRTESWLQAFPPPIHPSNKKPLKHGRRRIPKTWGATRPNKERGILRTTLCGCELSVDDWVFSWSREISVWCPNLSGNGSMDASRPWGTSHPLFFGGWIQKTHRQATPREAIAVRSVPKARSFWWISILRRLQMSKKSCENPYGNPFREISAVCCHRHGIPSMPASRLFPKGKGTELEKGESRIWVFPKIVVPQNGWLK